MQAARRALAAELRPRARRADRRLPVETGINGPDDYIGKHGDAALFALIERRDRPGASLEEGRKPRSRSKGAACNSKIPSRGRTP